MSSMGIWIISIFLLLCEAKLNAVQASLELTVQLRVALKSFYLLPLSSKCWDYRHSPSHMAVTGVLIT